MATWHQQRNRVPLYHETKWTIVSDPPGDLCTLWLEPTEQAAKDRLVIWESNGRDIRHCYILAPYVVKPAPVKTGWRVVRVEPYQWESEAVHKTYKGAQFAVRVMRGMSGGKFKIVRAPIEESKQ